MRPSIRHASTLSLFLAFSLAPLRTPGDDRDARLAEASRTFQRATAGDASAVGRASALFQELAAETPRDPVVLAYAGSAETMAGRDAASPIEAMNRTEHGLDQLDQALRALGPEHDAPQPGRLPARLETLLVAASTFLQVPDSVFHRFADGKAALAGALAHPLYARLPPPVLARFQCLSALVARKEQQPAGERAALEKAVSLDPSGPMAEQARARLAELSR